MFDDVVVDADYLYVVGHGHGALPSSVSASIMPESTMLSDGRKEQPLLLDEISYESGGSVAEIVLDRADQLNPISARAGGTRDQILWAVEQAEADPAIGCVLLRGAGRCFSSGGDLTGNAPRETPFEQDQFLELSDRFHDRLRHARVPLVAAVHGYCLGAALQLIAVCDFVLAAPSARFGVPEGRLGLVGAAPLVPIVGRQWAKFLVMTGEMIDADQASRIGLVLTVEPEDELLERARDLGGRLARLPRQSVLLNKRMVDAAADASGEAAGRLAASARDTVTLSHSDHATAPDGRSFAVIRREEGMDGLKQARAAQYETPWLRPRAQ
jgi:enoyl-CoA hydratase/carnithine racemase